MQKCTFNEGKEGIGSSGGISAVLYPSAGQASKTHGSQSSFPGFLEDLQVCGFTVVHLLQHGTALPI